MANMKVLVLLFLAVSVQFCLCFGDDVVERAKEKVKNLGLKEDKKDHEAQNVKLQDEDFRKQMTEAIYTLKDLLKEEESDEVNGLLKEEADKALELLKRERKPLADAAEQERFLKKLDGYLTRLEDKKASQGAKDHSEAAKAKAGKERTS